MMKSKSGERTLLASVLLSAPGPLVLGLALFFGRSSTQLADFIRRTAELAAIILSLVIYRILHRHGDVDKARKESLERTANLSVGIAMCLSGAAILFIAIFSTNSEKGNVIPGLVIAVLGVITNSWFWFRYSRLNREMPDAILEVQSRLYRAKSLVDGCVVLVLTVVAIAPNAPSTGYVDLIGSVVVSAYLIVSGVVTIRGRNPVVILDEMPDEAGQPLKIPRDKSPSETD
jgi:divalent metal cation (Fe/Co/Zn/Cd) transporter